MKILAIFVVGIVASGHLSAAPVQTDTNTPSLMIRSDRYKTRQVAIAMLASERATTISNLTQTLVGDFPAETKMDAAKALGVLRASEALDVLVDSLILETRIDFVIRDSAVSTEDLHPVSTALARIGESARGPLLKKIETGDDPKIRARCALVCLRIFGAKHASEIIDKAEQTAGNPTAKTRLHDARRIVDQNGNPPLLLKK